MLNRAVEPFVSASVLGWAGLRSFGATTTVGRANASGALIPDSQFEPGRFVHGRSCSGISSAEPVVML